MLPPEVRVRRHHRVEYRRRTAWIGKAPSLRLGIVAEARVSGREQLSAVLPITG